MQWEIAHNAIVFITIIENVVKQTATNNQPLKIMCEQRDENLYLKKNLVLLFCCVLMISCDVSDARRIGGSTSFDTSIL